MSVKVLFVLPAFYKNGAVDLVVGLSERLSATGLDICLLALHETGNTDRLKETPVNVQVASSSRSFPRLRSLPRILWALRNAIRNSDIVVCSWEKGPALWIPSVIARLQAKDWIVMVQNNIRRSLVEYRTYVWGMPVPLYFENRLILWSYEGAKAVVCVSSELKEIVEEDTGLHNIVAIPNGIDVQRVRRLAAAEIDDSRFNEVRYIIAVGRLSRQKGFDLLIRAFERAGAAADGYGLLILGEGEERGALESLAKSLGVKDSVTIRGHTENPFPLVKQASVFCLSSHFEGKSLALMEAAALGVPIVAFGCPTGVKEILENGKYGRLVPAGSVNDLSIAIREHLENPKLLSEKAELSRQDSARLDSSAMVQEYHTLLTANHARRRASAIRH